MDEMKYNQMKQTTTRAHITLLFQIIALCDDELQSLAQHNESS